MAAGAPLKLTIIPLCDQQRVAGQLLDEHGDRHQFSSWLGLLSLLEAARARAAGVGQPDPTSAPIDT